MPHRTTPTDAFTTTRPAKKERSLHSKAWRERYGRGLTDDEICLVQASRGISRALQGHLLAVASCLVLAHAARHAAKRITRHANGSQR